MRDYDVNKYERPSVTTDVVIFGIVDETLKVLLIKRKSWPFEGMWAIPGGFVRIADQRGSGCAVEIKCSGTCAEHKRTGRNQMREEGAAGNEFNFLHGYFPPFATGCGAAF